MGENQIHVKGGFTHEKEMDATRYSGVAPVRVFRVTETGREGAKMGEGTHTYTRKPLSRGLGAKRARGSSCGTKGVTEKFQGRESG